MRIAIGGLTGCGKTTLGRGLSKALNIEHITFSFKTLAKEQGVSLMEFQKMAEKDPDIDKKFDQMIFEKIKKTPDFVITTWLGAWFNELFGVEYDLRVWLSTSEEVKSQRLAKRDGISKEEALIHLNERDKRNRDRYLKLYNIDIFENGKFNLSIDNGDLTPEETVGIVLNHLKEKGLI